MEKVWLIAVTAGFAIQDQENVLAETATIAAPVIRVFIKKEKDLDLDLLKESQGKDSSRLINLNP